MKPQHLLSVYQGGLALNRLNDPDSRDFQNLRSHELENLRSLCNELQTAGCGMAELDGFFVGYAIDQISKEFDLLRLGDTMVVNIELKAPLRRANKEEKILRQLRANHHYLSFLGRPMRLFTYVEKDGFYEYLPAADNTQRTTAAAVADCLRAQTIDTSLDPDKLFVPANYLVSPFGATERFLRGEYFLTTAQQSIKDDIFHAWARHSHQSFLISSDAGTGKTLLLYDMAKTLLTHNESLTFLHCGPLNESHQHFRDTYRWPIVSLDAQTIESLSTLAAHTPHLFIDEGQCLTAPQLDAIASAAETHRTRLIISHSAAPALSPDVDILQQLHDRHPQLPITAKHLSAKIRTNKYLSSFIANLFFIGSGHQHRHYDGVSIDYFQDRAALHAYGALLADAGWTLLSANRHADTLPPHHIIGQDYPKVAVILDRQFFYDKSGKLSTHDPTYSPVSMIYQMVTRVIDELKIIVVDNPSLYLALLKIKALGD